jgi:hypothetical protein
VFWSLTARAFYLRQFIIDNSFKTLNKASAESRLKCGLAMGNAIEENLPHPLLRKEGRVGFPPLSPLYA